MQHIRNYSIYVLIAIGVTFASKWLESDAIFEFLYANLITLLIALLAINTTTLSVIMTKLSEISGKTEHQFDAPKEEMKLSVKEQVALIIITAIFMLIGGSDLLKDIFEPLVIVSNIVLISVFFISLHILYDISKSIFILIDFEDEDKSTPKDA